MRGAAFFLVILLFMFSVVIGRAVGLMFKNRDINSLSLEALQAIQRKIYHLEQQGVILLVGILLAAIIISLFRNPTP